MRHENKSFKYGDLPEEVHNDIFVNCSFSGKLPHFIGCEFHSCDLHRTEVHTLIACNLWSCNLNGANFSSADVRFSITNAGSPCTAYGAE